MKHWDDVVGLRHDRAPVTIVHQEIGYRAPIRLDHGISTGQGIAGIGRLSFDNKYEVRADDVVTTMSRPSSPPWATTPESS